MYRYVVWLCAIIVVYDSIYTAYVLRSESDKNYTTYHGDMLQ